MQCFIENMKKLPSEIAYNHSFFFSTALSCSHGHILKIHIENWAEAPPVMSTLWRQLYG